MSLIGSEEYRRHSWLPQTVSFEDAIYLNILGVKYNPAWTDVSGRGRRLPPPPEEHKEGKMNFADAQAIAKKLVEHLTPYCERIAVGGSVRRGKATVKDIELVVIPKGNELWKFLDQKLLEGRIQKAEYGHKNGKPMYRWGEKYRGFVWANMKIEVFAATPENWGYQYLLRTGPGDANTVIMTVLKQRQSPFKFKDGYAVRVDDEKQIIPLAEEKDVFTLLGLDYIPAGQRTVERYWREFKRKGHTWGSV